MPASTSPYSVTLLDACTPCATASAATAATIRRGVVRLFIVIPLIDRVGVARDGPRMHRPGVARRTAEASGHARACRSAHA